VVIRRLKVGDESVARQAVEVFKASRPSKGHLANFLANKDNYFYIAEVDEKPVGFLLAYKLERCDGEQPMMLLYEIEVLSDCRRRGIAKSLISEVKWVCQREQFMKAFVITSEKNAPAMGLYESTGGRRETTHEAIFVYRVDSTQQ
jgi:ribosomal protein S18 acetylase RimI-like enzyme